MAETKLSKVRVPDTRPKPTSKKLGLLTKGKRKMCSFRFKYSALELLEDLVRRGRKEVNSKMSGSDIIEASLHVLLGMDKEAFASHCQKVLRNE